MDTQNEQNEESDTDDEEIYFQKELEIALYSQIHFEPNTDSFTQDFSDLPYDIIVEGNDGSGFLSNKTTSDLILSEQLKEKYADDLQWGSDVHIKKVISESNRTSKQACDNIKHAVIGETAIEEKPTSKHKSYALKSARLKHDKLDSKKSSLAEKLILGHSAESDSDVNITVSDDDDGVDVGHRKESARLKDENKLKETSADYDIGGRDSEKSSPADKSILELSSDSDINITISDDDDDGNTVYRKESARLRDKDEFMEALTDDSESDARDDVDLDDHTRESDIQYNIVGGRLPGRGTSESEDNTDEEDWKILYADAKTARQSRYFKPVICFNCKERGHISNACPKPKKQVICNLCSDVGHTSKDCQETYCSNCLELGHSFRECNMPRYKLDQVCHRCDMEGHEAQKCPDQWRQFHQTVEPGMLVRGKPRKRSPLYCYNCGGDDHLGHECVEERANRYVRLTTPFVCKYKMHKLHKEFMVIEVRDDQTELQENPTKKRKTEHQSIQQKNVRTFGQDRKRHTDSDFVRKQNQVSSELAKPETGSMKKVSSYIPYKQRKSHWKKSSSPSVFVAKSFKDNKNEKETGGVGTTRSFGSEINVSGRKRNSYKKKNKGWKSHEKKTDEGKKGTWVGGETNYSGRNKNKKRNKGWKLHDKGQGHLTVGPMTKAESIPVTGLVKNPRGFKTKLKYRNQAEMVFSERQELNNFKITLGKPFKGTMKQQRNVVMDKNSMMGNNRNHHGKVKDKQFSKIKKRKKKE